MAASCIVAERCWDRVRWAIEEHAWRFDGLRRPLSSRRRICRSSAAHYDLVIIDGAPRVNNLGRAAILASDLVLIPRSAITLQRVGVRRHGAADQESPTV